MIIQKLNQRGKLIVNLLYFSSKESQRPGISTEYLSGYMSLIYRLEHFKPYRRFLNYLQFFYDFTVYLSYLVFVLIFFFFLTESEEISKNCTQCLMFYDSFEVDFCIYTIIQFSISLKILRTIYMKYFLFQILKQKKYTT